MKSAPSLKLPTRKVNNPRIDINAIEILLDFANDSSFFSEMKKETISKKINVN